MAKRKRLDPATTPLPARAPEVKSMARFPAEGADGPARPPIAQVAGDAASSAALAELADELRSAREGGRLVLSLPLASVQADYLVRDRLLSDPDEFGVLLRNIRAHGQRTPIEVVDLGGGTYGLISGWRRLNALRELAAEANGADRFGHVLALLRRPETASDAYRAMVEENELRLGLSYYERARIAALAADQGVYDHDIAALKGLFASATRSKRSKIGYFLRLYRALDHRLQFPGAIGERLGLALVRRIDEDDRFGERLGDRLRKAQVRTAEDELAILEKAAERPTEKQALTPPLDTVSGARAGAAGGRERRVFGAVTLDIAGDGGRLILSGAGVTPEFRARLEAWLAGP